MSISRITPSPPPAASGDAPINIGKMVTYAGIFMLAVGVNYFTRSMSTRQVMAGPASTSDTERLFNEALRYMELKVDGQPPTEEYCEKAITILNSVLEKTLFPSQLHAKILVQRGLAFMMVNADEEAIADFSSFLKHYPNDESRAGVFINRAHCYEQLDKFGEALKDFKAAESCTSDDQLRFTIFFNRGCLYQDQCDYENAIKDFERALECKTSNAIKADILHRLGFCSSEEHLYDHAIDYLTSALKCPDLTGPQEAEILYHRATVYTKIDDFDKALKDLSFALKNSPSEKTRNDIVQLIQEIKNQNRPG